MMTTTNFYGAVQRRSRHLPDVTQITRRNETDIKSFGIRQKYDDLAGWVARRFWSPHSSLTSSRTSSAKYRNRLVSRLKRVRFITNTHTHTHTHTHIHTHPHTVWMIVIRYVTVQWTMLVFTRMLPRKIFNVWSNTNRQSTAWDQKNITSASVRRISTNAWAQLKLCATSRPLF